ncbi:TIGR02587 family membrane protein [Alienimonas chondri]|uniref:TIGR02587 family membrane protein n=1 Tax=Alienimonas chondri TaxID=2681879 RepID=A0ABX1VCE2_9PLAN|nr:TIGR02587 family membrane protein [Alienimonas chondri]NNJ25783.1 hypothetical protein [Alienimonas chondri]
MGTTDGGGNDAVAGTRPIRESLREYGRGVIGGLLFSLPLLYTMEVWWEGFIARPPELLLYLGVTFVLLLGYNRYAGMRPDAGWREVAADSVEELGIALLLTPLVLFLLGRIGPESNWPELLGKVVVEAMLVAVGVSVGTAQLGGGGQESDDGGGSEQDDDRESDAGTESESGNDRGFWAQTVISFCGATLFAANVAPTEEITTIGLEASPARLLGLVLFSLGIGCVTLYFSGFAGADRHVRREGRLRFLTGTVTCYAIALAASAMMLWFFGRFDGADLPAAVSQIVVLALPGMLGASAGRLLIQ